MKIVVNRKKLIKALKRVNSIIKGNDISNLGKYDPLTVSFPEDDVMQFKFTDGTLIIQFQFKVESIEGGKVPFGVNNNQLTAIVSSLTDENVVLSFEGTILTISGEDEGRKTKFNIATKGGYFISEGVIDFSEKNEALSLSLDGVQFVYSVSSLMECPIKEGNPITENVIYYKDEQGSTCTFTASGTAIIHYDFETAYPFDKFVILPRRTVAYIASMCGNGTVKLSVVKDSAYIDIEDTEIGDGFWIEVKSKTVYAAGLPGGLIGIIKEKPVQLNIEGELFKSTLQRVAILEPTGCDLTFSGDKMIISAIDAVGNKYTDTIETTPISDVPMTSVMVNHKLVYNSIKHRDDKLYKIEVCGAGVGAIPQLVVTDEERKLISVIAGFKS